MSSILSKLINLAGNITGTLPAVNGGLATDASAFSGVVKASAGAFSAATIVNADVSSSAAIAGSKLVSAASSVAGVVSTSTQTFTGIKTFESQPSFFAYLNSAMTSQSLSTFVKVLYLNESFDQSNEFDTTNSKFVAGTAGKYLFGSAVSIAPGTNTTRIQLALYKNGSKTAILVDPIYTATSSNQLYGGSVLVSAAASDFFEIYVFVTGSGNFTVNSGSDSTYFWGFKQA